MTWGLSQLRILILPNTCLIYEVELGNFYNHLKVEKCVGGVLGLVVLQIKTIVRGRRWMYLLGVVPWLLMQCYKVANGTCECNHSR
jgi:hypothetical protein